MIAKRAQPRPRLNGLGTAHPLGRSCRNTTSQEEIRCLALGAEPVAQPARTFAPSAVNHYEPKPHNPGGESLFPESEPFHRSD